MTYRSLMHLIDSTERSYGLGTKTMRGTVPVEGKNFQATVIRAGDRLIVAFPGTQGLCPRQPEDSFNRAYRQWISNLTFFQTEVGGRYSVHRGYLAEADAMRGPLKDVLRHYGAEQKEVVFVGHSAGGAIAQIAASRLQTMGLRVQHVYTFAAPRAGDRRFSERMNKLVTRFEYQSDLVPHLPFSPSVARVATNYAEALGELAPQLMTPSTLKQMREVEYIHAGRVFWHDGRSWHYTHPVPFALDALVIPLGVDRQAPSSAFRHWLRPRGAPFPREVRES